MNLSIDMGRYKGYRLNSRPEADPELTHVTPGTPAGEYLRRFWHAIALSSEIRDLPVGIQVMGEDLVLFRDLKGRIGLLHRHCMHRQASLEYGRISEQGIRCCYHGWLFDVDGTVLDMPGEPDGGQTKRLRDTYRQGAYPALEYKGLVFAYMGPPELAPPFPIYDTFEIPETEMVPYAAEFPCNWLQVTENGIDPVHSMFLHTNVNGAQFAETWGVIGEVEYLDADISVYCTIGRRVGDNIWTRVQENILPNITQSGAVLTIDGKSQKYFGRNTFFRWCLPVDNTNTRVLGWANFGSRTDPKELNTPENIERLEQGEVFDRTYEEEQRRPGDYAAMTGQGPIVVHEREHFVTSDRGVARFRNRIKRAVRELANKTEPTQPTARGITPIPTYSGDTVLNLPVTGNSDKERVRETVNRVFETIRSADRLSGEKRDSFIIEELKKLERASN
ncbi:MAG: Rieske 2Fe-2S domain-containing protein [Rhodospirillaceae bacterium]|nr:Rieske 2Fe-2S domain-containing protein [Rhodospirillaceae bacterium]